jgi:DNA-binding transcriptional LysR family regulator
MARLEWYIRANLKPRHLQLLVALDDFRHVGRVAEFMNVTQPAVSKSLAEIERGIGLALFERKKGGLVPTPYGECLIRLCRSMLQSLDAVGEELRHLQSGAAGQVRLGVLPVAAPVLAPRAVIRMRKEAPRAAIVLHEATADRLLPMLREGQLDLIVGTLPPASMSAGLVEEVLHRGDGVSVVCGLNHPLARRARIRPADLASFPMIIPPLGTLFRSAVDHTMDTLDLPLPQALVESGSMTATNTLLRESHSISFYSPHLAHHWEKLGWLKILPLRAPEISVPIGCFWLKHAEPTATTRLLIDSLREVSAEALGPVAAATAPHAQRRSEDAPA